MAKGKDTDIAPAVEAMPQTGCVVCGLYTGDKFEDVTPHARVHAACAVARPDVVTKVKARG